MRDRFTRIVGLSLVAIGLLWLLDLAADIGIPWEWVAPVVIVLLGLVLVFGGTNGGGGAPPSQFERDDAPRVP